jgi:alpha-mannosidase
VYFAFPLALNHPQVEYQEASAWVNPETDLLPGANLDWFCTQGALRFSAGNQSIGWVSVDAPLFTLQDINRGLWRSKLGLRDGTLFSYVMNNYTVMSAPAQQSGTFNFRYVLTSGPSLSLAHLSALEAQARSPLSVIQHSYDKGWKPNLSENGSGFLEASPESVEVLAVRPLEEGSRTYLLRLHNVMDQAVSAHLRFPMIGLADAYLASPTGERREAIDWSQHELSVPMKRYDLRTVVISEKPSQN